MLWHKLKKHSVCSNKSFKYIPYPFLFQEIFLNSSHPSFFVLFPFETKIKHSSQAMDKKNTTYLKDKAGNGMIVAERSILALNDATTHSHLYRKRRKKIGKSKILHYLQITCNITFTQYPLQYNFSFYQHHSNTGLVL